MSELAYVLTSKQTSQGNADDINSQLAINPNEKQLVLSDRRRPVADPSNIPSFVSIKAHVYRSKREPLFTYMMLCV